MMRVLYCWNMVYVDTLWVDENYRGRKIGEMMLARLCGFWKVG